MNISINNALVGDAQVHLAVQKWLRRKERRTASKRGIQKTLEKSSGRPNIPYLLMHRALMKRVVIVKWNTKTLYP